jgi:hypothetical protein
MPANININYDEISTVGTALTNAATNTIGPQATTLNNQVAALLAPDGGLWLQKSSPALYSQWQTFYTSLQNGVAELTQFSQQFAGIVAGLQQMDTDLSTSINTPASGG